MTREPIVSRSAPYVAGEAGQASDPWAGEAASAGGTGRHQITYAGEAEAPPEVADALHLAAGARVVARRRLMFLDGQPVEVSDTYYPFAVAAGTALAEPAKIRGGAARLLANQGWTAARVHEEVTARHPTAAEQLSLLVGRDAPVLVLRRISYAADGTPFEAAVMTMRADRRILAYDLTGNP